MATGNSRKRKKKRVNKTKLVLCLMVEMIVILALAVMIGWKYGVEEWLTEITRPVVKELDLSGINSSHAVLMQAQGGKVIGEINGEERMYPASLTKIMTAIVAIEELDDLEQGITLDEEIFPELYAGDATQAGFQAGERVRAIDLLYGVILPSGAECCIGLANEIAGSEEAFVEMMNKKAQKLGMDGTHFCDTTGLHDPEHYSTAMDMAVLLKYAIRNDTFREIIESARHSTGITNVHPDGITYYSTMFKNLNDPGVTGGKILGGKTGFTNEAGLCLASFAEIESREYILVTAGAPGTTGEPLHVYDAVTVYNRLGSAAQALGE
ncbi:MAG: serine hydrolase [Eubacteriales bacterium]|nr:serine hydrolase [Eubacteriales bacterium]